MNNMKKIVLGPWVVIAGFCCFAATAAWADEGSHTTQPIMGWLAGFLISLIIFMIGRDRALKNMQRRLRMRD